MKRNVAIIPSQLLLPIPRQEEGMLLNQNICSSISKYNKSDDTPAHAPREKSLKPRKMAQQQKTIKRLLSLRNVGNTKQQKIVRKTNMHQVK
jgi:hypothetical protein